MYLAMQLDYCVARMHAGLSKRFLYFNDDDMVTQPIYLDDFYSQSGGQRVYLAWGVPQCAPVSQKSVTTHNQCLLCNVIQDVMTHVAMLLR